MRQTTNLVLDLVIAGAFLVATNPPLTGLAIHEWFGLTFAATIVAHLVLHWDWLVASSRRLFVGTGVTWRLDYAVDLLLFVALVAAVLSGVLISKHVVVWLGFATGAGRAWRGIHEVAANGAVVLMGVHLGLHWNWIARHVPRFFAGWLGTRRVHEDRPVTTTDAGSYPSAIR